MRMFVRRHLLWNRLQFSDDGTAAVQMEAFVSIDACFSENHFFLTFCLISKYIHLISSVELSAFPWIPLTIKVWRVTAILWLRIKCASLSYFCRLSVSVSLSLLPLRLHLSRKAFVFEVRLWVWGRCQNEEGPNWLATDQDSRVR